MIYKRTYNFHAFENENTQILNAGFLYKNVQLGKNQQLFIFIIITTKGS